MEEKKSGLEKFETTKEKILRLLKSEYLTEHEKKIIEFILYKENQDEQRERKDPLL